MDYIDVIRTSAGHITSRMGEIPDTAIVLGSGLGALGEKLLHSKQLPYAEIPNFPISTVLGHAGKLVCGVLNGKKLLCMSGRFHYYEGNDMASIAYYVRVMKVMGVKKLIITNAAGGINRSFTPGDLMLITDHIKFFDNSPLRGENIEEFGLRFNDMSTAYTPSLREVAKAAAKDMGITLKEGVYAFMPGPSFETPAEIRALSVLGADAVGMSTVPEVITATHCGINVLGISCITNMAAGILDQPLSHAEVLETTARTHDVFTNCLDTLFQVCIKV